MFDKLVESKGSETGSGIRGRLLTASAVIVFASVIFALLFSLFNQTLAMGAEPGALSKLLPPVTVPIDPNPPAPITKELDRSASNKDDLPIRREHIQRIDEPPLTVPDNVSTAQPRARQRPLGSYLIGHRDVDPVSSGRSSGVPDKSSSVFDVGDGNGTNDSSNRKSEKTEIGEPPPLEQVPKILELPTVINGKATYLDIPVYSEAAKVVGAKGQVKVRVLIDENGKVVTADVISGHPLLRQASLASARASKFQPTTLRGQPVSVRGIILYNFK
ncbi:MAG: energy transducer TonB [Acidobacteria bacterium]|nr:MAG: energy transducer TonB [Acidobacteriota bacterium]REK02191.1 MAG: energy transducer TonB [Acidobacteriota bacterium]REK14006.1 MAG: energy transducer TonB [Acidobacteriota bacterium]REK42001.1 MAG: energy transducer TonB [Acidobacteriota bacterium]